MLIYTYQFSTYCAFSEVNSKRAPFSDEKFAIMAIALDNKEEENRAKGKRKWVYKAWMKRISEKNL